MQKQLIKDRLFKMAEIKVNLLSEDTYLWLKSRWFITNGGQSSSIKTKWQKFNKYRKKSKAKIYKIDIDWILRSKNNSKKELFFSKSLETLNLKMMFLNFRQLKKHCDKWKKRKELETIEINLLLNKKKD